MPKARPLGQQARRGVWLRAALACALCCGSAAAWAQALPPEIERALGRAKLPRDAVSMLVWDADKDGSTGARLSHRANVPMNPASVMKLVTTFAALDVLGPAYVWNTPVYVDGALRDGVLQGNVYIQGQGDPKLVMERLWLLLRRLQGLGIRSIAGDVVLDRSAWDVPDSSPAQFDGEPLRPYNAAPDALLINFKSVVLTFTPHAASNTALVQLDPPLWGVQHTSSVPLAAADCGDYRAALKADFSQPQRIRFAGSYPAQCGEKSWSVAYVEPKTYALRAVHGLWLDMGGKLSGNVRYGNVPPALLAAKPLFEASSLPLLDIVRDINKHSNNVMAQQLFLTLGRSPALALASTSSPNPAPSAPDLLPSDPPTGPGSFGPARAALQRWWRSRIGTQDPPVLDNGSGLSRQERISAQGLGVLLQTAYRSPWMPEFISSLPITGLDGTLKRYKGNAVGSAHLKTGTLSNVLARAGYLDAASGKRYVLVALINHPNANTEAARAVVDALLEWATKDL